MHLTYSMFGVPNKFANLFVSFHSINILHRHISQSFLGVIRKKFHICEYDRQNFRV